MSGSSHFLLSFCFLGYCFCCAHAWQVKMPGNIKGLEGSCLVIPCRFDYHKYPPKNPSRVVWYQYVSRGYPLVYDDRYPNHVISKFAGKTQVLTSHKSCDLQINPVTWSHHRETLYPWVDPENIGKYTHAFYEKTVTIEVVGSAAPPHIVISGSKKVGQSVTVQCSVYHTCPTYPPTLSLPGQRSSLSHNPSSDGTYRTTLTTTLSIERDHQTVKCSVKHKGGHTASATETINAECPISSLAISPTSYEFLEGQATTVTCTASYTCAKNIPTLKWNYDSMPNSTDTNKIGNVEWKTVSTLTFTASGNDHGRSLTCYAKFTGGQTEETSIILLVKRNMLERNWSFNTPRSITGMKGSCVIIPCTFNYTVSQPSGLRVIWYLFQSHGYPAVFNQGRSDISKFSGITSLTGSVGENNCSLKIEKLEMSHNQDRLYPWVDKNPIQSYQNLGYAFYEKTSQLIVSDNAQEPLLSITGIPRVAEESTVSCTVSHTCISAPPILTLEGIPGEDNIKDTLMSDGIWERTVERTWTVKEEDQSVKCTVRYPGGQTATRDLKLNVECPYDKINMTERPGELIEGMATSVICSVTYKCKKNRPSITWNYEDMKASLKTASLPSNTFITVSNLTFIGSLEDNGKSLNCTAQFSTEETSHSEILHIKKYVRDQFENDTFHGKPADVPYRLNALTGSCVVIPCRIPHEAKEPYTRGIWAKTKGDIIYHTAPSRVVDHFKGRTRLLGNLNEGNCSLEIDNIKPFDNGPFCFYAERDDKKTRFSNSCIFIIMKASLEKPVMTSVPAEVDAGSKISVSCSVKHTCPSHPPVFSWSVPDLTSEVRNTEKSQGIWETTSTITFKAAGGDGVQSLICTATSWGEKQQSSTVQLTVKGSSSPAAIVVPLLFLIGIITAAVFGVVFYRRRKHSDASQRPPPRPEKRRSLWDRLSRRNPEDRERPQRPEKRGSIWNRLSRRADNDHVGWKDERGPRKSFWSRFSRDQNNNGNLSVSNLNNTTAVNCDSHLSKQAFPSPKAPQRPPRSAQPEDHHVYGNF